MKKVHAQKQFHSDAHFLVRTYIHKAAGCHLQEDAAQRPNISALIVATHKVKEKLEYKWLYNIM